MMLIVLIVSVEGEEGRFLHEVCKAVKFMDVGYEVDIDSPEGGSLQGDGFSDPHDERVCYIT